MAELLRHPEAMKKAQNEVREQLHGHEKITESDLVNLRFIPDVIKETFRLHPPAPLIQRRGQETTKIFGYDIPKDMNILVNPWAIGRDARFWEDVDEFKPERFSGVNADVHYKGMSFELLPFGTGRRICPAMSFAVANLELALASLLYHFDWELPSGMRPDQLDMTEVFGLTSRRKCNLLLHARPYLYASS